MEYNFNEIEKKWQDRWAGKDKDYWGGKKPFKAENISDKPKYYILDMFPYPSGAGLHVGHPLGYIASDIYSRYKRLKGFNVLHPMGYDAYGLPAEQYAIQTGQHPAITTEKNIARYREQLDKLGLSFDWDREVKTCDPSYYKWTQWVFIKLFKSWYNKKTNKAEPIEKLIKELELHGNAKVNASCGDVENFSANDWKAMNEKQQQEILMNYRLAYLADTMVNWCPALGTVLANDEVSEGISVRGGHPVVRKPMKQWLLRITAYADRLLKGLDEIDWSDSIKEVQRNWIGKSEGALVNFKIKDHKKLLPIFTTRPDTIFGVTYMAIAPEHELVMEITTADKKEAVKKYIEESKNRSDRERLADVKKITGEFSGAFAVNPFTGKEIPVWIADYVLLGYGTGAVMAVPGHDCRDYAFAKHFNIPIVEVIKGGDITVDAYESKEGIAVNSGFINGMQVKDAIKAVIAEVEKRKIGERQINYRLRDAIFSRQRYWGEPFPVYYKDEIPYTIDENELPLVLPEVDKYLPTETGEPPLARAKNWKTKNGEPLETNTMPGFAGSSAYYLRYMDPQNNNELVSKEANDYWQNVDLYIGGTEHATGHLIYSRFWNKFLFDLGLVCKDEPFKKLINQGMIQGVSMLVNIAIRNASLSYLLPTKLNNIKSPKLLPDISFITSNINYIPIEYVEYENGKYILKQKGLKKLLEENPTFFPNQIIIPSKNDLVDWFNEWEVKDEIPSYLNNDYVEMETVVEKMSKSKWNVVNPDDLVEKYGADTLRLYEMFLGPLEQHKPWDTNGIEGVFRFIKKLWRLYHDKENKFFVSDEKPTKAELKVLHKTIKKVKEDIERFSFNTSVSNFMICVNELSDLKCNKREILQDLAIILSPYAPHIAEELWYLLGNKESITYAKFPEYNEEYLVENNFEYPVSFNGKLRFKIELPLSMTNEEIEKEVLAKDEAKKWLEGKQPKKIIIVQGKIVNIVI